MDLGRFFVPEEAPPTPITPTRPIPTRLQPVSGSIQAYQNHPGSLNWLQSMGFATGFFGERTNSNVVATHLYSEESIHQGRRIGIVGTSSNNGSTNATAGMSNIAYMEFLAQNNVASARAMERVNNGARSPFIPISYSQIHSNQQQSNSEAYNTWAMQRATSSAAYNPPHPFHHSQIEHTKQQVNHSQELVNRNVSESSNTWTNNCQAPTTSNNGISVPYNTVYNLNSSHKTMLDAFSNGAISFSSVPVTPDNGKRVQNQISEIANGRAISFSSVPVTPDNGKRVQNQISEIANGHAISFSSVPVTPDNGKRVQNQISEIANGHTDADEQSKQEKGKQLAVSPTVNEDTEFRNDEPLSQLMECSPDAFLSPTKATNQNSGKRRHTIDLNVTPPQPKPIRKKHRPKVVREGKEKRTPRPATPKQPSTTEKPSGKRKYVRKNGLNASNTPSVVDVARETTVRSCKRALNFNLEDQAADRNPGTALNHQERPKSQAQDLCTQGLEVVVEKSPRVLPFDLNCSLSQVQSDFLQRGDNDYSSMPQQIDSEGIREIPFRTEDVPQSGHQPSQKSRNDSNGSDNAILAGSKRAYCGKTEEKQRGSTNLTDGHFNSLEAYQEMLQRNGYLGMHFPTIYKKKRTDKGQGSGMPDGMRRAMACRENGTNNGRSTPLLTNVNNRERNSQYDQYFHPITTRHTAEIPLRTESMSQATLDKQKCPEFMLSFGPGEMKTKKRSKVPTRVRDFASLTAIAEWNQLPATTGQGIEIFHGPQDCMEALAVDSPAKMPKKKRTKKRRVNSVSKARGPSEVSWPYMTPLDDIVRKLNLLSITGERRNTIAAQEQTAIVPFGQVGTMVPYEGQFDPTKRRRPRPKVDLDSETERVWKLLMEKDTEDAEETSEDKEKWWEGERRVFRGRAESFIARMHLVQGDRRFSQWKGSVVDSVIGVFLTQNVSDHLSSSAFMSLAARFPLQSTSNNRTQDKVGTHVSTEKPEVVILDSDDTEWHVKMPSEQVCDQGSITLYEAEHIEMGSSKESFQSNSEGDSSATNLKEKELVVCNSGLEICCKSSEKRTETTTNGIRKADFVVDEDRRALEDIVSSQNSEESSVFQTTERIGSCADSNSEADLTIGCKSNNFEGTSFMELLNMASKTLLSGNIESESAESEKGKSSLTKKDCVKETFQSIYPSNPNPIIPFSNYHLHMNPYPEVPEVECVEVSGEESRFSLLSPASEVAEIKDANCTCNEIGPMAEISSETKIERKLSLSAEAKPTNDQYMSRSSHSGQPLISSGQEATIKTHPHSHNNLPRENALVPEPKILNGTLDQRNGGIQQSHSKLPVFSRETSDVVESTSLEGKQKHMENKVVEPNSKEQVYSSERVSKVTTTNTSKGKGKPKKQKKATIDWDSLRRAHHKCTKRERSSDRMDSLDWEAVRCADVNEIAETIKERGMNHMLAERIKDFLNRLVREHGSIDLEWLRDVPPDKVKEYLLSVRGLGLKSVECVRLLTLHHLAFPVDTNVGRIAVRLGWVPLQPLPESLQLHLLELYPVQETIQKYLWPRLCTLDQRTLYELHYQMITFGKVFCSKSKPNCNACPMRAECKHFASAFASARLALPGPEEKGMVTTTAPVAADQNSTVGISPLALPLPEENQLWETRTRDNQREPIIEEPATPEPDCKEVSESDIEDAFWEDPDEIPTIKLNMENFTLNLQNYMQENIMGLQEGDMSKALVALTPEATSIPIPKLKNVSRLRTEHQVYELPDSHPLLKELDRREPDDPCSYLLAIWTPGETAESIQPPKGCSASQESGKLCDETTCFSCNSTREANSQMVRGTLLIPCKTAMRGSFPLNGTYFQVNEVFADHDSSLSPINVPRAWIWNLPRRTVFFGTSIPSIFKGLSTEAIQNCFWRGFVCVRGFDHKTRSPRPLRARLHFPASKMARTKTSTGNE